ncbi:hypothetical protein HDK90DRAFT_515834 [Phyllosticta capitalensis]|uniref:Uncharacterized protein n=2 Tax=Phyllosticta capitalensis TaxID=121624 RepID=A0ABR1Y8U2_9PEZI
MTSPNAGRATTPNDICKKFLGFEDVWYLIVAELEYHDMLAAQAALPVVDALLAQYRVPRRALFLEPMGPAIVWLHVHADLLLNDEIGRRHSHVLVLAVPSVVRKIEQEILRLVFASPDIIQKMEAKVMAATQWINNDEVNSIAFNPGDDEEHSWDVSFSHPTQKILRTSEIFSDQAFFHGHLTKSELHNDWSRPFDLHPVMFEAAQSAEGAYRIISGKKDFKLLDEVHHPLHTLEPYWQKSLLTQPPVASAQISLEIVYQALFGCVDGSSCQSSHWTGLSISYIALEIFKG